LAYILALPIYAGEKKWGLVFLWIISFLLAFTNFTTIPTLNEEEVRFSFGGLVIFLEIGFSYDN
jgi:hypothetical protein